MKKITFPFQGLHENASYENQPAGTCPDCLNVRAFDALKGRLRGGQRAGLSKYISGEINSGAIIQDLNRIKAVVPKSDGLSAFVLIAEEDGKIYKVTTDNGTATEFVDVTGGVATRAVKKDSAGNVYVGHATDTEDMVDYSLSVYNSDGTRLWRIATGGGVGGLLYDFIRNRVVVSTGGGNGLRWYDASDGTFIGEVVASVSAATPANVEMDSQGYYYVGTRGITWDGLKRSFWKIHPITGAIEWGFSFNDVDNICFDFSIDPDDNILVTASGSIASWGISSPLTSTAANVWQLDTDGAVSWSALIVNGSEDRIRSCDWSVDGHFYLGFDGSAGDTDTVQKINSSDRTNIWSYSTGAASNVFVFGIQENEEGTYIYATGTRENSKTVWKLTAADGNEEWESDTGTVGNDVSARIEGTAIETATVEVLTIVSAGDIYKYRGGSASLITNGGDVLESAAWVMSQPAFNDVFFVDGSTNRYYDINFTAANDEIKVWNATSGSIPPSCKLISLYRGRIVLSGATLDPYNWYMSKVGDPFNFDYFPPITTALQAVAGNNSEAGLIGDVINGIAPWTDDLCIFGCDSSIWAMAGDPAAGGSIDKVSDTGMTFGKAWAFDPNGVMYFHSVDGIYRLAVGGKPEPMTHGRLKRRLETWDLSTFYVRLEWDINQDGLYVFLTAQDFSSMSTVLFWERQSDAWWVDSYPATMGPTSFYMFDSDDVSDRFMLFGCKDGFVRKVNNASATDDSTGINSFIEMGPYFASPGKRLHIKSSDIILGITSGNVDFYTYTATTAEGLTSPTTRVKRGLVAGINRRVSHKIGANALKFKLQSPATTTTQWATESVAITAEEGGLTRKGRK